MYHTYSSGRNHSLESGVGGYFNADRRAARKAPEQEVAGDCCQVVQVLRVVKPLVCHLSSVWGFMKLSPSKSHIFRIVYQELCPSGGMSQRTAAVPAKAPGAAREEVARDCCEVVRVLRVVQPLVCHLLERLGFSVYDFGALTTLSVYDLRALTALPKLELCLRRFMV